MAKQQTPLIISIFFLLCDLSLSFLALHKFNEINTSRCATICQRIPTPNQFISRCQNGVSLYSQKNGKNAGNQVDDLSKSMSLIEKEVLMSTREKLDLQTVQNALLESPAPPNENGVDHIRTYEENEWKIPVAAGGITSLATYILFFHSYVAAAIVFVFVYFLASGDPMEEEGAGGALARILGRFTLTSIRVSEPKVKSVIRASIKGDEELRSLRSRVSDLERENEELQLLIEIRDTVEESISKYPSSLLRKMARNHGLKGTSNLTKYRLMMRLVEEGVLDVKELRSI